MAIFWRAGPIPACSPALITLAAAAFVALSSRSPLWAMAGAAMLAVVAGRLGIFIKGNALIGRAVGARVRRTAKRSEGDAELMQGRRPQGGKKETK